MIASNNICVSDFILNDSSSFLDRVFFIQMPRRGTVSAAINPVAFQIRYTHSLSDKASMILSKIELFKKLVPNWDSYGGEAPSPQTIDSAKSFVRKADENNLPFYFAAPGPNGEISIEFKNGEKEAIVYFYADRPSGFYLYKSDIQVNSGKTEDDYKEILSFVNS